MNDMNEYINFGCGLAAPENWRNFDSSPTPRLQRLPLVGQFFKRGGLPVFPENIEYGDIVSGLPIKEGSCKAIYCSHVIEHLALEECRIALHHVYTYLKPDGVFRFVLPDLEYYIHQYRISDEPDAAILFMQQTMLGAKTRNKSVMSFLRKWLGGSEHLWMWDYKALQAELQQVGFRDIRRASFNDSADPMFLSVEDPHRWDHCLGIECVK